VKFSIWPVFYVQAGYLIFQLLKYALTERMINIQ